MSLSLEVELLKREEAKPYSQLCEECPHTLAQQLLQWADIIAPISPDKPYFFIVRKVAEQSVIAGLPLYYFKGEAGGILTSVPHAGPLGGVLSLMDLGSTFLKEVYEILIKRATQLAEELRCVSLSIITNPFVNDAELYKNTIPPNYILNNFCQVVDLKAIFDVSGAYNTGKSAYNSHIRRNIQKVSDKEVGIQWGDQADFDVWYDIHCQRHSEIGATPLPRPLLKGILTILKPSGKGGLIIAKVNGRIVGGCIYIWNKEVVDAYMPSYETAFLKHGVNYAVTDFALRYFFQSGMRWFNFQSSYKDSGVYEFKKRWGSQDMYYQFLTWSFKDFEKILEEGVDKISKMYQWHFVAPFEAIEKGLRNGFFEKAASMGCSHE